MKTQKLFRMTTNRKILLDKIISMIERKIENVDADGLKRQLILYNDNLSETEKASNLKMLDDELQDLYLLHDVLETVMQHNDSLLHIYVKSDRGWKNEWDIPLSVFNNAMDETINILTSYQKGPFAQTNHYYLTKINKQIKLLVSLKEFRNSNHHQQ